MSKQCAENNNKYAGKERHKKNPFTNSWEFSLWAFLSFGFGYKLIGTHLPFWSVASLSDARTTNTRKKDLWSKRAFGQQDSLLVGDGSGDSLEILLEKCKRKTFLKKKNESLDTFIGLCSSWAGPEIFFSEPYPECVQSNVWLTAKANIFQCEVLMGLWVNLSNKMLAISCNLSIFLLFNLCWEYCHQQMLHDENRTCVTQLVCLKILCWEIL